MKKKTLNHHASDRSAGAKASSYFFESQQTTEQPLTRVEQAFRCRYAYGRAAETVVLAEKGQDYLAFAVDDNVCSFVLCDGVGLSYQGDFASRFLGSGLLGWLRKGQDLSRQQLDRKLMELTQAAAAEAASFHIDERTPQLLREVLQEKQRKGSEAMYICGRKCST